MSVTRPDSPRPRRLRLGPLAAGMALSLLLGFRLAGAPLAKGLVTDDVFKLLRGPTGSVVQVTIEREGQSDPLLFKIERAKIPIESVPYAYMIRPGVGYVRIVRFAQTTGQELENSLAKLHEQGMKDLVI